MSEGFFTIKVGILQAIYILPRLLIHTLSFLYLVLQHSLIIIILQFMDNANLSPHVLAQLQSIFGPLLGSLMQPPMQVPVTPVPSAQLPATPVTARLPEPSSTSLPLPPPTQPITSHPPHHTSVLPTIPPYRSARLPTASQPPSSTGIGIGYPSIQHESVSTQPRGTFLGFEDTRHANQQRLASASATLPPRRPSVPVRTARTASAPASVASQRTRTRGRAVRPPSLAGPTTIGDCVVQGISGEDNSLRIRCKVYPPLGVSLFLV